MLRVTQEIENLEARIQLTKACLRTIENLEARIHLTKACLRTLTLKCFPSYYFVGLCGTHHHTFVIGF